MALHAEVAGEGPAVALVHEGIGDSRMWDPQWEPWSRSFRLLRVDLRGFGRSPLPPEKFSNARDLIAALDEHGFERAALVGGSLGGRVVLEVAVARPDLVSALVLVAPGLPGHEWSEEVRASWEEEEAAYEARDVDRAVEVNLRVWVDGPGRRPEDVDPGLRARVAEMQRRAFELQFEVGDDAEEELLVPELAERLAEVGVPTLLVVGEEDLSDLHVIARRIAGAIAGARLETIPDTAHVPNMERPREFDELVLPFLREAA
ncbi:MAG: alpha/beta fold hydrolase [Gaiellaceae bacterium]